MSKKASTYKTNKEIEAFIKDKKTPFTQEDISYVNQYKGYGGMWDQDPDLEPKRGLYEYYTPIPIIEKMVGLAHKHGYDGGPILEPSCGIGRFLHYFSPKADVTGVEPDPISYEIAKANFPEFNIQNSTFNELFVDRRGNYQIYRKDYSLLIGNPPYGAFTGKFTSQEKKVYKPANYVEYFIVRGLSILRSGGLLIYIIPSSYLDSSDTTAKAEIREKAKLIDAYRLPAKVFDQTDIQTDIIVYQKK
jgi:type I restriction-modification system DNA methylase subunit